MKRQVYAAVTAMVFSATAALANPQIDSIVGQLQEQGFSRIEIEVGDTLILVDAVRNGVLRTFFVDRLTGKVMDDRSKMLLEFSAPEPGVKITEIDGDPTGSAPVYEGAERNEDPAVKELPGDKPRGAAEAAPGGDDGDSSASLSEDEQARLEEELAREEEELIRAEEERLAEELAREEEELIRAEEERLEEELIREREELEELEELESADK